ncbi:SAV_915 family protein [Saccharopolyspora karakumensis]|uniref:SAV_915 family protein n=1 Tax=Saccharopolyspora karakumensis TaxID=2530386 RepID=UPI00140453BD|nr:SAV_915 family protein [Saccharopolyspora karakumensis]
MGNENLFSADDQGVAPAVFGVEAVDDEDEFEPEPAAAKQPTASPEPVFVVPSEVVPRPQAEVTVQLGRTEDDELVLLAFSSPERLAACLGDEQPWVAIPQAQLEEVQRACGAELVEIDPVLPAA